MACFLKSACRYRQLIWRLTEREVIGRYRGSVLGLCWSFLQPLMLLAVYTLVFSTAFRTRWPGTVNENQFDFAINLFAGLIVFNVMSECLTKAPSLILSNPSYVKKVVFPLEILGFVTVGCATFHALISLLVLILFEWLAHGRVPLSIVLLPVIWIPLVGLALTSTWIISALGVYIRDIGQAMGAFVNMLLFTSPVFFPLTAMPERWQSILRLNPLSPIIEQTRNVAIGGNAPSASYLALGLIISLLACELAFRTFVRARRGFADVM